MVTQTTKAKQYEPTGDSGHVSYGKDFIYTCTCGKTSPFITTKEKQTFRAESHEKYCNGTTTVDTV